jgi:predicted DNA binding protein
MHEATFHIEGEGAYATATAGTDTSVELWCNDHCDLLYVTDGAAEAILIHVRDRVGILESIHRPKESVIVTAECLRQHENDLVESYLARHGCLLLPPLRYADGGKLCQVLALDPAALTACYRDFLDDDIAVSVERKREIETIAHDAPLLTLDGVLPDLSPRQREVFSLAYDRGYYEVPRETTTTELAAAVGIERRTAEEHLRHAERKLVSALIDYVRA